MIYYEKLTADQSRSRGRRRYPRTRHGGHHRGGWGDPVFLFAFRRRTYARLSYWERGTPAHRRKVQVAKWAEQGGLCAIYGEHGAEMDRLDPILGYNVEIVRIIHHGCHVADQKAKSYY